MQHLTEEQLVSHYYHDDESLAVDGHLRDCTECISQYDTIKRVLALVTDAPVPERGDDYGDQVWSRLRWKLGSQRRRTTWVSGIAAAAALAIAFFAGHFWRAAHEPVTASIAAPPRAAAVIPAAEGGRRSTENNGKILLLVVGDHLDNSERVLLEVANADPGKGFEIEQESRRAGELVAANRIYRQTATKQGNERIASVLADLEPVLIEISHAGTNLSKDELTELQKRIEAKGLLFKVRVISAQSSNGEKPPRNNNINADTL
jgi:hypothetical protein